MSTRTENPINQNRACKYTLYSDWTIFDVLVRVLESLIIVDDPSLIIPQSSVCREGHGLLIIPQSSVRREGHGLYTLL